MSRALRVAAIAAAFAAALPVTGASAQPPPPRPFCELHFRDQTISNNVGLPDITYPEPYWVC